MCLTFHVGQVVGVGPLPRGVGLMQEVQEVVYLGLIHLTRDGLGLLRRNLICTSLLLNQLCDFDGLGKGDPLFGPWEREREKERY